MKDRSISIHNYSLSVIAGVVVLKTLLGFTDTTYAQNLKEKLLVRDTLPEAIVLKAESAGKLKRLSDSVDYAKANPHWSPARISRTLTTIGR